MAPVKREKKKNFNQRHRLNAELIAGPTLKIYDVTTVKI
jgi:hypothetical protein